MPVLGADEAVIERPGDQVYKTNVLDLGLYRAFARTTTPGLIRSTSFFDYLVLDAEVPEAGDYEVHWSGLWSYDSASTDIIIRLVVNGVTQWEFRKEPKDSAGTGIVVDRLDTTGTRNTGTDQREDFGGHDVFGLPAGPNEIKIEFAGSDSSPEATLYQAVITLRRF